MLKEISEDKNGYLWAEYKPKALDFSVLPHFDNPKTDNERLFNLQYDYRNNKNAESIAEMYKILKKVSIKIITKECKKRKLRGIDWREKAQDVASYIIEQYLTRKCFVIKTSFVAYCFLQAKHEIFYQKEIDKITDFVGEDFFRRL